MTEQKIVTASAEVDAPADTVFELIADPSRQPEWDGNDNLQASTSPRVTAQGNVFVMTNANGNVRQNVVVAFVEGRTIAWLPGPVDEPSPGHLWRWDVEPIGESSCRVTHTYDWTALTHEKRMVKARSTTSANLQASVDRLKALAETL